MGNIQSHISPDPHRNPFSSPRKGVQPTQGDRRAKFYQHYRREAEEYDKDMNTTLIFVSGG